MADDQQQQRREEHWKELAALLGIEPEVPALETPAQVAPATPIRTDPEVRGELPTPAWRGEVSEPAIEIESGSEEPAPDAGDLQAGRNEPEASDRPPEREEGSGRRGGRRRRGRGRGGDRKDDSRHKPYQRRRDEAPAAATSPAQTPEPHMSEPAVDEPAEEEETEDARREAVLPRPRRGEERFAAEEPEEAADADDMLDQPIPGDEDDELDEEDAPAEWNVVTWSELIASLKRF